MSGTPRNHFTTLYCILGQGTEFTVTPFREEYNGTKKITGLPVVPAMLGRHVILFELIA